MPVFHSKYAMLKGDYANEKLMEESNLLAFMSKTAIARAIVNDPRFKKVEKKDLYKIFGNCVCEI